MDNTKLDKAIEKLARDFDHIEWKHLDVPAGSPREKTQLWPGNPEDDVMICVYKGHNIEQLFHRQDFFFFNFAYQGDYGAISYQNDNHITIHEGECYIGQPYAGYAPNGKSDKEMIIVGVLIQTHAFFKTFFHILSVDSKLFHFFLNPQVNEYSDEFIQLQFDDVYSIKNLLNLMILEYASPQCTTQEVLQSLTLTLMMLVARQYKATVPVLPNQEHLSDQIIRYMNENLDTITLKDAAAHFSYHPNYISTLIHKEIGRSFSELLLEQRMNRATALLKGTNLSIEEIAIMLGYSNPSNFYKAFRSYFHASPREYINI